MQSVLRCEFEGCAMNFQSRVDLEDHMQRDHIDQSPLLLPSPATQSSDFDVSSQSSGELSTGFVYTAESQELGAILDRLTLPANPMSSVGRLSEKLILHLTDQARLEDVTVLVMSDVGLSDFGNNTAFTVSSLINIKELNLSYNYLTDVIDLSQLISLERLHLSHNMISSLLPIHRLRRLKYLSVSHNQLTSAEGLDGLPHLAELNLAANRLCEMDEVIPILKSMPALEMLQLSGNPLMGKDTHMRYVIICQLQLRVLDGEAVTNLDFDIALDVEIKRLLMDSSSGHFLGFGVQDLGRSGIAGRVLSEIRKDRKFSSLLSRLTIKAKSAETFDEASHYSLEFILGRMLHKLYQSA